MNKEESYETEEVVYVDRRRIESVLSGKLTLEDMNLDELK